MDGTTLLRGIPRTDSDFLRDDVLQILHVAPGVIPVPSRNSGAVENIIHELCGSLVERGHDLTLLDVSNPERQPTPYRVVEVPAGWGNYRGMLNQGLYGFTYQRRALRRLESLLAATPQDVVHFYNQFTSFSGIPLAQRHGALAVFHSHNPTWGVSATCRSVVERAKFTLELRSFQRADLVLTCGSSVAANLTAFLGVPDSKIVPMRNGLDESWFGPCQVSDEFRARFLSEGEALVLHVGRLVPYKNQITLVRAAAQVLAVLPKVRFLLVGPATDARYGASLRHLVASLGLKGQITFAGELSRNETRQLYHVSDVVVLCSVAEAQPMSLLEAMAAGKPVVGSAIDPIEEVLPQEARLTVPPTDSKALATAILMLLQDQSRAKAMGLALRDQALRHHNWPSIVASLEDAYLRYLVSRR